MNILVVGFGNMGCRHVQSLLNGKNKFTIFVLEPNDKIIKENKVKINIKKGEVVFVNNFDELPENIDLAVIATSAFPRFEILKKLLNIGVNKFLLEKVVFQSEKQFDEIIRLLNKFNAVAFCNFVNRYFPNYQKIKDELVNNSSSFKMIVSGGEFGLSCNALHYIDLFEFLSNEYSNISLTNVCPSISKNKRGEIYREVDGQFNCKTPKGNCLLINSDIKKSGGVEIIIIQDKIVHILNEESLKHIRVSDDFKIQTTDFCIKYTSELTSLIVDDIFNNKIILPSVQETKNCHIQFFKILNKVFNLAENDLCPIT